MENPTKYKMASEIQTAVVQRGLWGQGFWAYGFWGAESGTFDYYLVVVAPCRGSWRSHGRSRGHGLRRRHKVDTSASTLKPKYTWTPVVNPYVALARNPKKPL